MIICSDCKHGNLTGAMFCAECGAQLVGRNLLITQSLTTDKFGSIIRRSPDDLSQPFGGGDTWGSLHLIETGQILPLSERNEFTMGRISEGQPISPDIDFSPYQGYDAGVSRMHALIKRDGDRIILMDLGSANGTYWNGTRLSPNVEQIIHHRDIVALGKMKIQIMVKN